MCAQLMKYSNLHPKLTRTDRTTSCVYVRCFFIHLMIVQVQSGSNVTSSEEKKKTWFHFISFWSKFHSNHLLDEMKQRKVTVIEKEKVQLALFTARFFLSDRLKKTTRHTHSYDDIVMCIVVKRTERKRKMWKRIKWKQNEKRVTSIFRFSCSVVAAFHFVVSCWHRISVHIGPITY